MQNYLDQLAKLNELLAQQPVTVWGVLSFVVMLVLSLGVTVAGMILVWKASPIDTLIRAGLNIGNAKRITQLTIGMILLYVSVVISPLRGNMVDTRESERIVHNTLMDMTDIDYKTLVEGTQRYELNKKDKSKYKALIKIIEEASKRRPVQ
jgi:hypothetical protein